MIASYKRKANIAGAIFLAAIVVAFVGGLVLAWTGHNSKENIDVVSSALTIPLGASLFYGMWAYLKAKGRSWAWLLLGGPVGLIVILLLKDHAKDGQPPAPPAAHEYFG
jgi:fructose-specific phosphotransferase system IIC component